MIFKNIYYLIIISLFWLKFYIDMIKVISVHLFTKEKFL